MSKTKKCCICGERIYNYGNNPHGAEVLFKKKYGKTITWKNSDECCEVCNMMYVIPGRLMSLNSSIA